MILAWIFDISSTEMSKSPRLPPVRASGKDMELPDLFVANEALSAELPGPPAR